MVPQVILIQTLLLVHYFWLTNVKNMQWITMSEIIYSLSVARAVLRHFVFWKIPLVAWHLRVSPFFFLFSSGFMYGTCAGTPLNDTGENSGCICVMRFAQNKNTDMFFTLNKEPVVWQMWLPRLGGNVKESSVLQSIMSIQGVLDM